MKKINIRTDSVSIDAEIYDTPTGNKIFNLLPLKSMASVWGEEVYFDIDVKIDLENDARDEVEVGELGYWPVGTAFCIFFGHTPVSDDEKPLAYSPVNVFGKVIGDATVLRSVEPGDIIEVEAK